MTDKFAAWKKPSPHKKLGSAWVQWRSTHVIAFILLMTTAAGIIVGQTRLSQQSVEHSATATLDVLASQYSLLLAEAVEADDSSRVNSHLERLILAPAMIETAFYRTDGSLFSRRARPPTEQTPAVKTVTMTPVTDSRGKALGMLKIVADEHALLSEQVRLVRRGWTLQGGFLFTGFFAGIILTLGIWRYRFILRNKIR